MKKKDLFGININIILLSIVSFLNDLSSEMITPILPLFIKQLGGTGIIVGLIGGLRESIANILKVVSGYISDKTGKRKIFIFLGYLGSAIFKFFIALSKTWQQLLIFFSIERTGKGLREAPRDALIAEYSPDKRGKAFGFHRTLDTSGAILGSITVFLLFWILKFDFRSIIITASLISFSSIIPIFFVKKTQKKITRINIRGCLKTISKPLKLFFLISGTFSLANFSYMFFILKAQESFSGKAAIGMPIFLYILYNIFYASFSIPLGICGLLR